MDFNYLYHRQGVERMRAAAAATPEARRAHQGLAENFGDRIESLREDRPEAGRAACAR